MNYAENKRGLALLALTSTLFLGACAAGGFAQPRMASPQQMALVAPEPIRGNSGEFMSPYTSDGTVAEWAEKATSAKMGAAVGGMAGRKLGEKAMENVPFFGGMLGQKAGEELGRKAAIEASGGWESIKGSSDLSFNNLQDMAIWMYANHSSHSHYQEALDATMEIYPDLKVTYQQALMQASQRARTAVPTTRQAAPSEEAAEDSLFGGSDN